MKDRLNYQLFAQRLFQVLFVIALIGLLATVVVTGLSNFHPALPSRRELMPDVANWMLVAIEIIPLLHYLFFTLFFYQLSRLFHSFNAAYSFSQHAVRSSRLLSIGCLSYAALNLIEIAVVALMGFRRVVEDYFTNTLLISMFVSILALLFFLQHRAYQEALRLQAENELTI